MHWTFKSIYKFSPKIGWIFWMSNELEKKNLWIKLGEPHQIFGLLGYNTSDGETEAIPKDAKLWISLLSISFLQQEY